jgi:hypothetical protein
VGSSGDLAGGCSLADFRSGPLPHRGAAPDALRRKLSQIPSLFGRLVHVASLCDGSTGRYRETTLAASLGAEDADRTLCLLHHQLFSEWLSFNLSEQKSDLEDYLAGAELPKYASHLRLLVPRTARDVERQLFLTDLETLVELLKFGGGPSPIPGSSRLQ